MHSRTGHAVNAIRGAYRASPLPLDLPGVGALRPERARIVEQFDDYLLPRISRLDAPLLVVVGGPTGVGKSTLVNSLVGRRVTEPGVLRPTTRSPVLVHHPDDGGWFTADRLLPHLERVDHPTDDHAAIQLVADANVPRNLAILDAPDFDSIDDGNRELATRLLAAADLWLFVTSANRYSDQVPWQHFEAARDHDLPVAVVMNRIQPDDLDTVSRHLARMVGPGVADDRTFYVEYDEVGAGGLLPPERVDGIRTWLASVARDDAMRSSIVDRAVRGALNRAVETGHRLADAVGQQIAAVDDLLTLADRAYDVAATDLVGALGDGTLLRGELQARWCEFVGADAAVADLATTMASLRGRLEQGPALSAQVDQLGLALDLALETLLVDHAEHAAERASAALRQSEYGDALLSWSTEDLTRPGRGLSRRARTAIGAWRRELVDRVAHDGGGADRTQASALAVALVLHGVSNGSHPDGAGGLVAIARKGVVQVMQSLLAEERGRYLQPVLGWQLTPDAPARLRAASRDVASLSAPSQRLEQPA